MFNFLASSKWAALLVLLAAIIFGGIVLLYKAENKSLTLKLEQAEAESKRFAAVALSRQRTIGIMQNATLACIEREAQALIDLQAREAITSKATVRTRTQEESKEVIDDATRKAVINRLNRPL